MSQFSQKTKDFSERVRLKANLANMEFKSAWHRLEEEMTKVSRNTDHFLATTEKATDEAQLQAHLGAMEARERWHTIRDHLKDFCRRVGDESHKVHEKFDHTKLQASLAKMEAKDALEEHRTRWRRNFQNAKDLAKQDVLNFRAQYAEDIANFTQMLPR